MHNLPVLWLVVGLLSLCHAPVPIVGQLKVALLLCVVHAVQCAVSVPGLWSRQQWQLVWAGPRVLLCSRAETGHRRRARPAMAQRLRPTIRSWLSPPLSLSLSRSLSLSLALSLLHLKSHPQNSNGLRKRLWKWWEHDKPLDQITAGLAQPLCNELTYSKSNKSTCRNVSFRSLFFFSTCYCSVLVTIMMLCYLACFGGCRIVISQLLLRPI